MVSLISQISPRKWIFQLNHFSLFIKGSGGFDGFHSFKKKCQKIISWHCHFKVGGFHQHFLEWKNYWWDSCQITSKKKFSFCFESFFSLGFQMPKICFWVKKSWFCPFSKITYVGDDMILNVVKAKKKICFYFFYLFRVRFAFKTFLKLLNAS